MLCLGSTTDMHKDMLFARQPMKLETGKQSHHVLPGDGALVFSKLGRTVHSCHARSNQTLVHRNRTYSVTRHRNIVALHDIEATLAFFEKPWKCTVKFSTTWLDSGKSKKISAQHSAIQSCKRINVELCPQYEERTLNDKYLACGSEENCIFSATKGRLAIKTVQESSTSFSVMGPCQTHLIVTTWKNRAAKRYTCCKTLVGPASSNNFTCVTRLKHWPRDACTRRDQDIPVCQNSPSSAFTSHQLYTTHLLLTLLEVLKNRTARGRGTNSIMPTTPWSIGLFNQGRKPLDRSSRKKHANSQ